MWFVKATSRPLDVLSFGLVWFGGSLEPSNFSTSSRYEYMYQYSLLFPFGRELRMHSSARPCFPLVRTDQDNGLPFCEPRFLIVACFG